MTIIDESFKKNPKSYIVQSLLAIVAVTAILAVVEVLTHAAIVAALGASTFIVFAMPHSITARPRRLIGGHVVGLAVGSLCYLVFFTGSLGRLVTGWPLVTWVIYALTVGLAIFLMAVTNTEHPPAASTALGIVVHEFSYEVILFVLMCAVCLALVRRLLRRYLRDLF